jgi:hypothetical protein
MHAAFRIYYKVCIIVSKAARALLLVTWVLTGHVMLKLWVLLALLSSFRQMPRYWLKLGRDASLHHLSSSSLTDSPIL